MLPQLIKLLSPYLSNTGAEQFSISEEDKNDLE
jgi:hypothetical protein